MGKVKGFEAIVIGGKLKLRIETRSPVTIGAGKSAVDPLTPDIPLLKDSRGRPVIPGSTLKGFFRSYVEKGLLAANIKKVDKIVGDLFGRIAGREGWGSKLLFSDAIVRGDYKILSREHIQIDPRTMAVRHGPFEQEYVPAGVIFEGIIGFRNIPPSVLSFLASAALLAEIGVARIGRSKSRGYGYIGIKFSNPEFFFVGDFTHKKTEIKYTVELAEMDVEINVNRKNGIVSVVDSITEKTFEGNIGEVQPILLFAVFKWKDIERSLGDVVKKLKGET